MSLSWNINNFFPLKYVELYAWKCFCAELFLITLIWKEPQPKFDFEDKECVGVPIKFEYKEVEAFLEEDCCPSNEELA